MTGKKIDLSHQEVDRILEETERFYTQARSEWLALEPISELLCRELGYEDMSEFEDALHGTFHDFLKQLPNFEFRTTEENDQINVHFKIKPDPEESEWVPRKFIVKITDVSQLWNVVVKSQHCKLMVPEIEFEMCADGKKHIDTIYNHLSRAGFDLGNHMNHGGQNDTVKEKILYTVMAVGALRDVDYPWTLVVIDPSGISEMSDMTGVQVITGPEALIEEEAPLLN